MSVTLDDVRLARKRAYDRVDYWLQKYQGVTIHEAGISIPRIPKDLHPSEYGEWFDYYESFTGAQEEGGTQDYLEGENEPPELNPEYHPEPEPIEPDFPEEPEPPEPVEDEWTSDDVSEAIDNTLNGDDDDWWDADDWDDDDTAPDPVDLEESIVDNAFGISDEVGGAIEEALSNIREQYENIGDLEGYASALEDVLNDNYLWNSLQRVEKYKSQIAFNLTMGFSNTGTQYSDEDAIAQGRRETMHEFNHALQKLYRHFGMKYYREY